MLVMQQSNRHALLSPSPSPGSLSLQSYQRTATTPPNFTELVNHQQTPVTPAISPYSQQPYNSFGLPCSHISHIGAGTNNYSSNYYTTLTNSTYSPNHLDSSPIVSRKIIIYHYIWKLQGSPSSSIPSPQSPQLTISENTGATSISYESPTSSTVLKYTSYLNYPQASNYMIAPPQSTDTSPSTHYSPGLSDPPCYNSSSTPGFNYSNYFTNGTSYSSAPSTLYPIQDYTHQYQNNGASSSVTHTALWRWAISFTWILLLFLHY